MQATKQAKRVAPAQHAPPVPLVVMGLGNHSTIAYAGVSPVIVRSIYTALQPGQHPLKGTETSPVIEIGGKVWHCGDRASQYQAHRSAVVGDKTELARLFFLAAVPCDGGEIDLICEHHSADHAAQRLIAQLQGVHSFRRNGRDITLTVRTVTVVDEAIGAWHYCRPQIGGWALILDIGAGTWLARIIDQAGNTIAGCTADKAGVYRLATMIGQDRRLTSALRPLGITRPSVTSILDGLSQNHQYEFTGVGWGDWWTEYRREWFAAILNEAKSEFQPYLGRITHVVVCGGGSRLVSDLVIGKPGFIIPQPPELASVMGQWQAQGGD